MSLTSIAQKSVTQTFFVQKPGLRTGDFMIMVPQDRRWENMITEIYGERARIVSRYAIKKEPDIFALGIRV